MNDKRIRIAELRKERNMTQKDLADSLFVSKSTVSKWENNVVVPDIYMMEKMAELFQVSVVELLDTETQMEDVPEQEQMESDDNRSDDIQPKNGQEEKTTSRKRWKVYKASVIILVLAVGVLLGTLVYCNEKSFHPRIVDEFYDYNPEFDAFGSVYNIVVVYSGKANTKIELDYGENLYMDYKKYFDSVDSIRISFWKKKPEREEVYQGESCLFLFPRPELCEESK